MKLTKLQLENLIRGEISTLREASLEYGLEDTASPARRSRQPAPDGPWDQSEEERMAAYNQVRATMKPVVADEKTGKYLVTIEIVDPERTWETAEDVTIDLGEELLVPYLRDIFKTADYVLG
jgi:hypothetical protein